MDNLGAGIESINRTVEGRPLVEYWVDGYLAATVTLKPNGSPSIGIMPAQKCDVMDVLRRMAALNFACSRAAQLSSSASQPASPQIARQILLGEQA